MHGGAAAQDVDAVVKPPQQPGVVEATGLPPGVGDDGVGVGDLQAAPGLAVLVPGLGFLGDEVGAGEEERFDEVVPVGLAREVGHLEVVPRRLAGLPGE